MAQVIEDLTGKSCSTLFAEDGEEQFRSVETAVLTQVQAYVRMVVGTGGGIVKKDENWGRLQRYMYYSTFIGGMVCVIQ